MDVFGRQRRGHMTKRARRIFQLSVRNQRWLRGDYTVEVSDYSHTHTHTRTRASAELSMTLLFLEASRVAPGTLVLLTHFSEKL